MNIETSETEAGWGSLRRQWLPEFRNITGSFLYPTLLKASLVVIDVERLWNNNPFWNKRMLKWERLSHCFKQNSQIRWEAFDDKLCSSEVLSPLISSLYSRALLFSLPEIILIFEAFSEFRDFLQRGYKTLNTNHADSSPLINY